MLNKFVMSFIVLVTAGFTWQLYADDDHEWFKASPGVKPVDNPIYQEECGSCHMAYPPGLLPTRSWEKIMAQLNDHFGDNAELDAMTKSVVTNYLMENSAERSQYRRSRKIMRKLAADETPMRITELRFFKHEHDEIPRKILTGGEFGGMSQCQQCHKRADAGSFSENDIQIPGFGKWDD